MMGPDDAWETGVTAGTAAGLGPSALEDRVGPVGPARETRPRSTSSAPPPSPSYSTPPRGQQTISGRSDQTSGIAPRTSGSDAPPPTTSTDLTTPRGIDTRTQELPDATPKPTPGLAERAWIWARAPGLGGVPNGVVVAAGALVAWTAWRRLR